MQYHIDDACGYIGDLGSQDRIEWMFDFLGEKDRVFRDLYDYWFPEDLATLKKALAGVSSDDDDLNCAIAEFREMVSRCRSNMVFNDGCNDYFQF